MTQLVCFLFAALSVTVAIYSHHLAKRAGAAARRAYESGYQEGVHNTLRALEELQEEETRKEAAN